MVASWGGYVFIINIIPLFVLGCIFINKLNVKIFIAYNIFYTFGTLIAMLITFVNFQVIRSSEHLLSHITFISMNIFVIICYIKENLPQNIMKVVVRVATVLLIIGFILLFVALTTGGRT
jgi:dolichyl-diphosphooligosaccharide--protein glycosyltransferase